MHPIPFFDLEAQIEGIRGELRTAIDAVLDSREFILGRFVDEFEKAFAANCGVPHAIGVNSGTSALHLALLAAGAGPGSEVITVPFTFAATVASILYCGATPVLVDVDPVTLTIDPASLEAAITPATKAVVPVHLYGQSADMDPILEIAQRHRIRVVEDAAQAHGGLYRGKPVGSIGDLGCFSFYPTKNLGSFGEAGLVTTNDAELARTVRLLRDWGQDRKYHHVTRGFNYRMEGLQGAVLKTKLPHLPRWTAARRAIASRYQQGLSGIAGLQLPVEAPYAHHVYHTYTIRTEKRDSLNEALRGAGIGTAVHYPIPLHKQPAYTGSRVPERGLPHSEAASRQVLSLPVFPELDPGSVQRVIEAVRSYFESAVNR